MKTKTLTTFLLLAGLFAVSSTAMAAEVRTDKADYAPGEIAMIAGWGFYPNELIDLSISIDDPLSDLHIGDWEWAEGYADGYGEFLTGYTVPQEAEGMNLTATAMGLESSLTASVTFTDSVSSATITSPTTASPVTVTSLPASVTIAFDYSTSTGGTTTGEAWVLGTSGYATKALASGSGKSDSIMVTIPAGTSNGSYNAKVTVTNGSGTGANSRTDVANNAVIVNVPAPPTNNPPVITALNPTVDLGAWVGCLGGPGFSRTFAVSYAVVAGMGNSKIVQATFTLPDGTTKTVDVANVTDTNAGDTITVTLANGTNPVTISGPGDGSTGFSVGVRAFDGTVYVPGPDTWVTCDGTANAQIIYNFVGFLPPLDNDTATKVKRGSTVPVKFQLFDCGGTPITTGHHEIDVTFLSATTPYGDPDVSNAGASNDDGFCFRYSAPNWIFNLKTNTSYGVGASYTIWAYLDDGTSHSAVISIK